MASKNIWSKMRDWFRGKKAAGHYHAEVNHEGLIFEDANKRRPQGEVAATVGEVAVQPVHVNDKAQSLLKNFRKVSTGS